MTKTHTPTLSALFTLTALLALVGCVNPDDSGNKDSTDCQSNCDSDTDTADPPATMQLAYLISELGTQLGDVIDTHLGDQSAKSGDGSLANAVLTLEANQLTWLTAGDANNLVDGEVTPKFEDEAGLWATMPRQLYYDAARDVLDIYSPTYDPSDTEPEAALSTYPIPDGVMTLTANLNLWFDLGAATCHYVLNSFSDDFDQSDLAVKYGFKLEVTGVTDGNVWLEIAGDSMQLAGPDNRETVVSSSINQKDGIVSFTTSAGESITCQ